ncbi:hypothetical protein MKW92_040994 [Papaver armeniacum]|nr:hypothetical protein MKW92_040994 [Papaver armeniacum]
MSSSKKNHYKEKMMNRKNFRLGSFHAVAPPGAVDLRPEEAMKISIENSKYLEVICDVEHTHLVKGLDYALLNKVRSEIKKPEDGEETDGKTSKVAKEDHAVTFRTATAKSVYQWIVKPQTTVKLNEMFLPGRMSFIFNMEENFPHDIPTTVHRSKADCPDPEELVTVSVDGSVLERISKIMSYLRLGTSGKVLKKKKKDKDVKAKISALANDYDEDEKPSLPERGMPNHRNEMEILPPPPPLPRNFAGKIEKTVPIVARVEEEDIFVGEGVDYAVPTNDMSPAASEDMEESPRDRDRPSYFNEPEYGPVAPPPEYGPVAPPPEHPQNWQQMNGYDAVQAHALAASGYQGEWQNYQYSEQQMAYPEQYLQPDLQTYDAQGDPTILQDPHFMTQEEKDRGLGSVFKRDDQRLQQLREKDAREKDPNFISDSYSECYPGYQEYNREVAKGRLHRWDFETDEEWATYNEQKEAMPKAAFQFGVKMADGRKTRKQNKDQKLTNELHKINKILLRKKMDKEGGGDDGGDYDDEPSGKKMRS